MFKCIFAFLSGHQVEGGEGAQYVQFEAASGDEGQSGEEGEAQQVHSLTQLFLKKKPCAASKCLQYGRS